MVKENNVTKDNRPKECLKDISAIVEKNEKKVKRTIYITVRIMEYVSTFDNYPSFTYDYMKNWGKNDKIVAYIPKILQENTWEEFRRLFDKYGPDDYKRAEELAVLPKSKKGQKACEEFLEAVKQQIIGE